MPSHPATSETATLGLALLFAGGIVLGLANLLPVPALAATGLLAFAMAAITINDIKYFLIPDRISLPAVLLGAVANIVVFHGGDWRAGLTESAIGAGLAAGAFYALRVFYQRFRGFEGLGLGDVKLAAAAGSWLGYAPLAMVVLTAALAALVVVLLVTAIRPGSGISATTHIPFGSFLAPAILLFWILRLFGFSLI